jgi:DNA polymerase III psi subunit
MNAIQKIQAANVAANSIIGNLVGGAASAPDAVEARRAELLAHLDEKSTKAELLAKVQELTEMVLVAEKIKPEGGVKIETVAKALLESVECACLTYEQIAGLITASVPESKTSSKSIASYVSKHKEGENAWHVVNRDRIKLDMASLLAIIPTANVVNG